MWKAAAVWRPLVSCCSHVRKKINGRDDGGLLREAGMLMIVFVFVDLMFSEHPPRWEVVALGFVFGVFFIYLGVDLERRRR